MVALTKAEICVLVKWHCAQPKRIVKIAGTSLCDLRNDALLKTARDRNFVINECKEIIKAHMDRAKGLQSILKS